MTSRLSLGPIVAGTQLPDFYARRTPTQAEIEFTTFNPHHRPTMRRSLISHLIATHITRTGLFENAWIAVNHVLDPVAMQEDVRIHQAVHLRLVGQDQAVGQNACTPCRTFGRPVFEGCYRHPSFYNNICANCLLLEGGGLDCDARTHPLQGIPPYERYENAVKFPISGSQPVANFNDRGALFAELNRCVKALFVLAVEMQLLKIRRENLAKELQAMRGS